MALSKRTINQHNIKRAEVFKALGLNNMDVQYAHPKFEGYGHGTCGLCGQQHLKWLFSIKFDTPSGIVALAKIDTDIIRDSEVTITPVGSKCINDWLDAIPETAEKLEALKRWDREMRRCKEAMKAKIVEDLCAEAGYATPEDAFDAYTATSNRARYKLPWHTRRQLANNAYGIKNKRSSRATVKKWLDALEALLKIEATLPPATVAAPSTPPSPAPSAPSQPVLSAADADVVRRAKSVTNLSALRFRQRSDFADILAKVEKAGQFASGAQRQYFTDMLKKLGA